MVSDVFAVGTHGDNTCVLRLDLNKKIVRGETRAYRSGALGLVSLGIKLADLRLEELLHISALGLERRCQQTIFHRHQLAVQVQSLDLEDV